MDIHQRIDRELARLGEDENALFLVILAREAGLPCKAVVGFAVHMITAGFVVTADGAIAAAMEETRLYRERTGQARPAGYVGKHRA